jgi:tRNA dimethylallyltransferase
MARMPAADAQIRAALAAEAAVCGWPALHARLASVDPVAAARIAPKDAQRIQRALEVHTLTGTPLSELQQQSMKTAHPEHYLRLVLAPPDKSALDARLSQRFDAMLAQGLLEEVRALRARGDLDADLPAIRSVGYRQLWMHLDGQCDLAAARELAIIATRQLAKRQYTWLRSEPDATWLSPLEDHATDKLCEFIDQWCSAYRES